MRRWIFACCAAATSIGMLACDQEAPRGSPARTHPASPPSLGELRGATYRGLGEPSTGVTLVDGRWEGEPIAPGSVARPSVTLVRDLRVTGDLDGDGAEEAVVSLARNSGGTGQEMFVAVVARRDAALVNIATAPIGDRVQLREARIADRRIVLDLVQAGPQDAACCPGDVVQRIWELHSGALREIASPVATTRLSLATLAGPEWVLAAWSWTEPAAAPEVTLRVEGERFAGKSGCNRYFTIGTLGPQPGDLTLGETAGTRMACPDPVASVEDRYLKRLSAVTKFGFVAGQLALTSASDRGVETLFFAPRPAVPPKDQRE